MKREELIELKKQLGKLSKEEWKMRNHYLRSLANGELQGPPVGYPSIDKSWLKYYTEENLNAEYRGQTFYEFLYNNNQDNLDGVALRYTNIDITFRQLFEKIDECAKSLIAMGVGAGDTVGICAPTTPETVYLLYAINKIGAVANLIDIRKKSEEIEYCLNVQDEEVKPVKVLFAYDGQVDRIKSFVDKTSVERIVSLSPLESLPSPIRFAYNPKLYLKSISKEKDFDSYSDFLQRGKDIDHVDTVPYDENKTSFVEYTSGSTGMPKPIALNDSSGNHRVFQYMHNGMEYDKGDVYLDIIPIFLAFGAFVGIHLPLAMGMTDELIPAFDVRKIYSYFKKSEAKHMTLTPPSFVSLVHHRKFKKLKRKMAKLQTLGCGGDGFTAYGEEIVVTRMDENGCPVPLNNGYGCSEIGAPFCTQKNSIAKFGSVGIPLPWNNVVIMKHGTLDEVPVNTIGDVCMVVDYPMLRYIGLDELTKQAMVELPDGRIGIKLEDAGYVDSDGNIFIKGRYENAIKRGDNYIWPVDLENIVMHSNMVKICSLVPVNEAGLDCRLFIVPEKNYNAKKFDEYLRPYLEKFDLKYDVRVLKDMTLTSSGKIDRKKLKKAS